jgi:hypothetical protein
MADTPKQPDAVDQPEPEQVIPERRPDSTDHEASDADDRPVELDDPAATEPPIDDEDRDRDVFERGDGG